MRVNTFWCEVGGPLHGSGSFCGYAKVLRSVNAHHRRCGMDKRYINKSLICSIYTILLISDFSFCYQQCHQPMGDGGEERASENISLIFLMHDVGGGRVCEWELSWKDRLRSPSSPSSSRQNVSQQRETNDCESESSEKHSQKTEINVHVRRVSPTKMRKIFVRH